MVVMVCVAINNGLQGIRCYETVLAIIERQIVSTRCFACITIEKGKQTCQ